MYGDQFRSPGRDDRQDPQRAPWEAGHSVPANDDVKVAGAPNPAPPGFYDAGVYETTAYDEPSYETPVHDEPGAYGPGAPEGNATAAYDMGTPYDAATPYEAGDPYAAGATSAMPPFGDGGNVPPAGAEFEDMRRTPHAANKRMIKFAAVAAAVAVVGGGGVAWAVTGSGGSGGGKVAASRQAQAQVPAPAPLTDAQRKDAEDKRRKELKKIASRAARDQVTRPRLVAKGTPPPTKKPAAAGTAGDPVPAGDAQRIARGLLPSYGWSPSSQFGCLVNLWNRESGWNTHAANPSGAYGIPQAKPGSKMASAGPDWQNNATTQIKWGLGYIKSRYSTPCGAWAQSQSSGWY